MKYGVITTGEQLQGRPVFENTNVPVQALFEYFEDGKSVNRFLEDYPAVNKKQAAEVIQMARLLITSEDILKAKFSND